MIEWIKEHNVSLMVTIAIIAACVSIKSCINSDRALQYSEKILKFSMEQREEETLLVLASEINNKDKYFKVFPVDDSMVLQYAQIYYPTSVSKRSWIAKHPTL